MKLGVIRFSLTSLFKNILYRLQLRVQGTIFLVSKSKKKIVEDSL